MSQQSKVHEIKFAFELSVDGFVDREKIFNALHWVYIIVTLNLINCLFDQNLKFDKFNETNKCSTT